MNRILVADDHPLFRAALRQAAAAAVPDAELSDAADLEGVLAALSSRPDTDLVLLDLRMPGSRGLSGLAALRGQFPGVAVLVVSAHDEPAVVRRVLAHGAAGFIPKSADPSTIAEAVRSVLEQGHWLPHDLARAVAAMPADEGDTALATRLSRLTEQQFRVLSMLAEGLLNKQIADRLNVQERTVKAHVTAIFKVLGVANRTQAALAARSVGVVFAS